MFAAGARGTGESASSSWPQFFGTENPILGLFDWHPSFMAFSLKPWPSCEGGGEGRRALARRASPPSCKENRVSQPRVQPCSHALTDTDGVSPATRTRAHTRLSGGWHFSCNENRNSHGSFLLSAFVVAGLYRQLCQCKRKKCDFASFCKTPEL